MKVKIGNWELSIVDKENVVNDEVIKGLEEKLLNETISIYHNDRTCEYWIFDFKVKHVWFEADSIDMCNYCMDLIAFK